MKMSVCTDTLGQGAKQWANAKHLEITCRIIQELLNSAAITYNNLLLFCINTMTTKAATEELESHFSADTNICFEFFSVVWSKGH